MIDLIIEQMAAFSTPTTLSSLSYHHLLTNGGNNHQHHRTSPNINTSENLILHDIAHNNTNHPNNTLFDGNTELSYYHPSHQQANLSFDVSSPSSNPNEPLARHLINYRSNLDPTNQTGNYYSTTSSGSFINGFDYSYPTTITPSSTGTLDAAVPSHHHSMVTSYAPYPPVVQPTTDPQQNMYPWMRRIQQGCGMNREF